MLKVRGIVAAMLLGILNACASTVARLPPLPQSAPAAYLLGAGDILQVVVYGEPDLSGTQRISDAGTISLPLVGAVPAEGLTLAALHQQLVDQLDAKAVKTPNVTITISEYRPFFILGEVNKPGAYAYTPGMTTLTAVAIAGGFTYRAAQDAVTVTRRSQGTSANWRALPDSFLLPGDVITVSERHL